MLKSLVSRKKIFVVLSILVGIYLLLGVLLYFFQTKLLFHPVALPASHRFQFAEKYQEFSLQDKGEQVSVIHFSPKEASKGAVLFFHGNMQNMERYAQYPSVFLRKGYDVWMLDYPTFGKTTGALSQETIYRQALLFDSVARSGNNGKEIIIYGKSIGTGIAAYVAANRSCDRLILETPYYNIDALARHYFPIFPVMPMTKFSFPTNQYLKKIAAPVTILHGDEDEVIPYTQALRLKKENPSVELVTIHKGGHNDLWGFKEFEAKINTVLK